MTAPSFHVFPVNTAEQETVHVLEGKIAQFHPGTLPTPDWCALVNPDAQDNPEATPNMADLTLWFEGADALLVQIATTEGATVRTQLWEALQQDLSDHATCMNGGAYCLWSLGDSLVIGGFDNGGSDIAQETCKRIARLWGTPVQFYQKAHFDAHEDTVAFLEEKGQALIATIRQAHLPSKSTSGRPLRSV